MTFIAALEALRHRKAAMPTITRTKVIDELLQS
jgi:hypothetical protein